MNIGETLPVPFFTDQREFGWKTHGSKGALSGDRVTTRREHSTISLERPRLQLASYGSERKEVL